MALYSFPLLLLFSVVSAACYIAYDFFVRQNRVPPGTKRLPGPKGVPILGSVPQLPKKDIFLKFSEWRQEYGPIYQVNLVGTNYVWLSSHKVADDLLGKRSNIYCHRPRMATGHDNRTSMHYLPLMNYCDDYVRGINFKRWLLQSTKDRLKTLASQEAKTMVLKLQAHPADYKQHIERCCAGISTRMAWNDASPSSIEETLYVSNALLYRISPDGEITMKLPILRRIPEWVPNWLQPWKVAEIARYERERDFWFDRKNKVASQELAGPSWMQKALESKEKVQLNDTELGYAVGMMALIGGVLVSSPLQSFFLCMCLFPEWQVKAQEELDMVCGDRVPQFEDIQRLPVVRAIIREVFRWRTPLPVGVPHVTDRDDIYEGYHIPKGSVCFSLEWSLNQDPTLYPEPQAFKPERWLDPNFPTYKEPQAYYPSLKGHSGFGWGRRACPGQDYCEIVHFTTIATTLWSSRISNKKDPITGEDILPPLLGTSFVIVRPNWWAFDVVARDERKVEALRD